MYVIYLTLDPEGYSAHNPSPTVNVSGIRRTTIGKKLNCTLCKVHFHDLRLTCEQKNPEATSEGKREQYKEKIN